MDMFCFQCQETARNEGCKVRGVCGKLPEEARYQDLLLYVSKGVALCSHKLRKVGKKDHKINYFILDSLFTTITNANFDKAKIFEKISNGVKLRDELYADCLNRGIEIEGQFMHLFEPIDVILDPTKSLEFAGTVGVLRNDNVDRRSLVEAIIIGLKGLSAYVEHAANLSFEDESIIEFIERAYIITENPETTIDELIALLLETGENGVKAMALLDKANTSTYGHPEMGETNIGVGTRPGILISGHDLHDMEMLMKQTENTGVDVYTHGEMLPANYYPAFKKYSNLVGNYGNAWWRADKEFLTFNGPILFTSNCIVPHPFREGVPNPDYVKRVFTTNSAGMTGCPHIIADEHGYKDFSPIIEMAKACQPPVAIETGKVIGGFAHNQVLALADKVVEAVKSGAIKRFVLMGGCDGRHAERKYYEEFAKALPKDTIILTSGCAKFRYLKLDLGDIGGIPRVLDAGQCNDSYSLVVIALALKEAFGLADVNDLPITFNIAWYEQKAAIVLYALLYLGFKNVHIGPTLPAFVSPTVLDVLVKNFSLGGISTVENDLKAWGLNY